MSYYPGQGYGGGGGGYGHAPPPGPPPPQQGYGYAPSGPPPPQQGYGGQPGYRQYPPPPHSPPPGLDAYGYPIAQGHHGHAYHARSGPPPPSVPQQFGHGAPDGYTFQYSNCTGRRKALLIGINYFGQDGELRGCINDVHNVSAFLVERHGYKREDMVILTDDQSNPVMQPTRANIIQAMGWLVSNAQPNDALFLHYSGKLKFVVCIKFIANPSKVTVDKQRTKTAMKMMATTKSFTRSISKRLDTLSMMRFISML